VTDDLGAGVPTRLVLPVPELADRLPGAAITLLAPFLPADTVDDGVVSELEAFFAALVPFAYVLGDSARFPSGTAYLPPQPAAAIRRLTHDLRRAFPELVAPASLHAVTPHLVLPAEVEVVTPLEVHAREALLVVDGPAGTGGGDGLRVLARFRFGTSAA
jgi:hypothetical protein